MPLDVSSAPGARQAYWSSVVRRTLALLAVWFVLGLGLGVLFVDRLDSLLLPGGMPLGFWISQQGAICGFVVLVFGNAVLADRLEGRIGRDEGKGNGKGEGEGEGEVGAGRWGAAEEGGQGGER